MTVTMMSRSTATYHVFVGHLATQDNTLAVALRVAENADLRNVWRALNTIVSAPDTAAGNLVRTRRPKLS